MKKLRSIMVKLLGCSLLFLGLVAATSRESGVPTLLPYQSAGIPVAYASGCDGGMPPPDLDCPEPPPTPTATPTPKP